MRQAVARVLATVSHVSALLADRIGPQDKPPVSPTPKVDVRPHLFQPVPTLEPGEIIYGYVERGVRLLARRQLPDKEWFWTAELAVDSTPLEAGFGYDGQMSAACGALAWLDARAAEEISAAGGGHDSGPEPAA
jgi:hypothetical protein